MSRILSLFISVGLIAPLIGAVPGTASADDTVPETASTADTVPETASAADTVPESASAADTTCHGAQGDKATPFGSGGGVPLPEVRTCLNPTTARILGGKSMDMVSGLAVDSQGNAYIAGETKSYLDSTYGDIFIGKLSPAGDLVWLTTFGGKQDDGVHAHDDNTEAQGPSGIIAVDESDNIYVVGRSKSNSHSTYAGFIAKLDPKGKVQWSKLFRPEWGNMARLTAEFNAVKVAGGIVHIAGMVGGNNALVYALDAQTGATVDRISLDPSPGYNDAAYSLAVSQAGDALWIGGKAGSGNPGLLARVDFTDNKYTWAWTRKIPIGRGSNFPSMEVDAENNLYALADIHGANTHLEIHKYNADGRLQWVRRYPSERGTDKNQGHALKVVGDKILVVGRLGLTGTYTHIDSNGDSFILLLDSQGNLLREHYFFTGTNPASRDAATDVDLHQGRLYVVGWHFGMAMGGEWRNPNDYDEIQHTWEAADKRDYLIRKADTEIDQLEKAEQPKDTKEVDGLEWYDEAADYAYIDPLTPDAKPRSHQILFWTFDGYLE